ncbi:MAG TPA: hypothetical protein VLV86_24675 [Vicinamibacterales bacterium]|nr:hypothetical protein [Vicinamibacterales bacterium]
MHVATLAWPTRNTHPREQVLETEIAELRTQHAADVRESARVKHELKAVSFDLSATPISFTAKESVTRQREQLKARRITLEQQSEALDERIAEIEMRLPMAEQERQQLAVIADEELCASLAEHVRACVTDIDHAVDALLVALERSRALHDHADRELSDPVTGRLRTGARAGTAALAAACVIHPFVDITPATAAEWKQQMRAALGSR